MHVCIHIMVQCVFRSDLEILKILTVYIFDKVALMNIWSFSDVTSPKFSNCPMMPIYVDEMEAVSYAAPTPTDNSGLVKNVTVMPYNFKSGTVISGDVNVTYTAVDNSGNSDSCTISFMIKGKM